MTRTPDTKVKKVLDQELWDWYNHKHPPTGAKVSKTMLQARAKWVYHQAGMVEFKASDGWYRRFMCRWRSKPDDIIKISTSSRLSETSDPVEHADLPTLSTVGSTHTTDVPNVVTSTSTIEPVTTLDSLGAGESTGVVTSAGSQTAAVMCTDPGLHPTTAESANVEDCFNFIYPKTCPLLETSNIALMTGSKPVRTTQPTSTLDPTGNLAAKFCDGESKTVIVSGQDANNTSNLNQSSNSLCLFLKDSNTHVGHLSHMHNVNASSTVENNSVEKSFKDYSGTVHNYSPVFNTNRFSTSIGTNNNDNKGTVDDCPTNTIAGVNDDETYVNEYEGEIIDCLSKFIDTSELSQTSMDFFYDSEDSSFSTAQNAFLLAETENQSSYDNLPKTKQNNKKATSSKSSVLKMRHRKRGERYLPQFKERVLAYVSNQHTMKQAARKYKIHERTIAMWRRDKGAARARDKGAGSGVEAAPADEQFITWLRRCRERDVPVTGEEMKRKARQLVDGGGAVLAPKWFSMWTNRLFESKAYLEGMENPTRKKEASIQYGDAFKLEVAAFAEIKSQMMASKLFNVSRKRVFDWLKLYRKRTSVQTNDTDNKRRCINLPDAEVDEMLWKWYQDQEPKPDNQQVRAKGREMYSAHGKESVLCSHGWYRRWCERHRITLRHDSDAQLLQWALTQIEANKTLSHLNLQAQALRLLAKQRPQFKASSGWALRFCRRHPHLLERTPDLSTPLPSQLPPKVARFRCAVRVAAAAMPLAAVGNMDELHLSFAAAGGGRPLLLRRSAMENCHATVVLACLADGNMLPPVVILKSPPGLPAEDEGGLVWYQANAQLDDACMAKWVERVWFAHVASPNLLVVDCYPPHSTRDVKQAFAARASVVKVIPGGCASKLQPLGVSIAKTFESLVMKQWESHNSRVTALVETPPWDAAGKFKMPDVADIAKWVDSAYTNIQLTKQETIRRCFLATGLTVASNHSEDHFIENLSMIPSDTDAPVTAVND